jgi:hypothetical protein
MALDATHEFQLHNRLRFTGGAGADQFSNHKAGSTVPLQCTVGLSGICTAGVVASWADGFPIDFTPKDIDPVFTS